MIPFLKQVAMHYFAGGDISALCFVLPNRRSCVFLRKYVGECAARAGIPVISPLMVTMDDFVHACSGSASSDQVTLLVELYGCYKALNPQCESLDDFIFWGGVLLSDFNDVDKYLVNPAAIFTNISDFRSMQDSMDYLDESQKAALSRFFRHFHGSGKYREEFRKVWDILLPLYTSFNSALRSKGLSYDGQAYRTVAEMLSSRSVADILSRVFPRSRRFVFVGLNALSESERLLLSRMRDSGLAEFCWDFSGDWIRDPSNKSSFFLSRNVADFPQAFSVDGGERLPLPRINVLSVPSAVGQAKQLPEIFRRLGTRGIDTAVVIPDEGMLIPVLNSIPPHIADINVTMGYPMRGSGLWSLMNDIDSVQMHMRQKDGRWFFYHRNLWALLSNSLLRSVLDDGTLLRISETKAGSGYYVPADSFSGMGLISEILVPVVCSPDVADPDQIRRLQDYQRGILSRLAPLLKGRQDMALELDFAKAYYTAIGSLGKFSLPILPGTYFRLLDKLAGAVSVPFEGEPLRGLQIMGPLETRALDFDNVVILGCNEGTFPRRNVSSSFIPPELRRGFGLPTYEYQDAVWAYYFYRLVQRAGTVWMLYDSRTEGLNSGEESRYIKQLRLHFGADMTFHVADAAIRHDPVPPEIVKTEEDICAIRSYPLSASAIQNYLDCPAKFYFSHVKRLRPADEVAESLDKGMVGNVFHNSMCALYDMPDGLVRDSYLKSVLDSGEEIGRTVRKFILEELSAFEVSGRNIIFEDLICRYVRKCMQRDLELMAASSVHAIRILGLETTRYTTIAGFKFKGRIDRLDSVVPGVVRVVDYKTGKVDDKDFIIDSSNAASVVEALFSKECGSRPKIALQLYVYDRMVACDASLDGCTLVNSIYKPSRLFVRPVENIRLEDSFLSMMDDGMGRLLAEISDPGVPFERRGDERTCGMCDFRNICGR